jgi:DNA replication protein DnaC
MFKKFTPCRKCNQKANSQIPTGFYYDMIQKDGHDYKVVVECPHHQEWKRTESLYKNFIKAGFDKSKFEWEPTDYVGEKSKIQLRRIQSYVSDLDKNAKIGSVLVYMSGPNGTQKTTIANWIGRQRLLMGYSVHYVVMKKLVDTLWNSQRDEEAREIIDGWKQDDLIIIDEAFDKKKNGLWESGKQIGVIDEFVRERINLNKGIIFISNCSPWEIKDNDFSISLVDLIQRELKKYDSHLIFEDNYIDTVNTPPERLF